MYPLWINQVNIEARAVTPDRPFWQYLHRNLWPHSTWTTTWKRFKIFCQVANTKIHNILQQMVYNLLSYRSYLTGGGRPLKWRKQVCRCGLLSYGVAQYLIHCTRHIHQLGVHKPELQREIADISTFKNFCHSNLGQLATKLWTGG